LRAPGQIAARGSITVGIAKEGETGVAVAALQNLQHVGRVGSYGER
jgi:LDH2 family malate/lactate/ureidoglycolate dehydrogenase